MPAVPKPQRNPSSPASPTQQRQWLGRRASPFLVIGLCGEHHQGASGWHGLGKRAFFVRYRLMNWISWG